MFWNALQRPSQVIYITVLLKTRSFKYDRIFCQGLHFHKNEVLGIKQVLDRAKTKDLYTLVFHDAFFNFNNTLFSFFNCKLQEKHRELVWVKSFLIVESWNSVLHTISLRKAIGSFPLCCSLQNCIIPAGSGMLLN